MGITILASIILDTLRGYLPLAAVCVALILILVIFKLTGMSVKLLWKILINSLIGAAMLVVFDILFASLLHMEFFRIDITWLNALVAGVLGVPGVIILLILKYVI